jgi:hypothetical protein
MRERTMAAAWNGELLDMVILVLSVLSVSFGLLRGE